MKTVSQNFKDAQKSNLIYPVRKVELFRNVLAGFERVALQKF